MKNLDWIIISIYLAGMIFLGWHLGKGQKSNKDYFLGSKNLPWWSIGLSTMATQLGAISFISAPAFVGLRPGGGLIWLGYEFAVPFAMIILIWKVIPVFHKLGIISIYEYLEIRFDKNTRKFVSFIFLLSRGLATGVSIYATAIVISVVISLPLKTTIFFIGAVAVLYDYMGGIRAVVYSDVIQMSIIFLGIFICGGFGIYYIGGWQQVMAHVTPDRINAIDFYNFGLQKGSNIGFLPMITGGFFLYVSYYGFDQSQVQRELSARSLADSRKSLVFNAIMRFPMVLSYSILGLIIGAYAVSNPEFFKMIPKDNVDYMIPVFIKQYLPAGLSGIIVVAIMAASMSSLDSALNSLSASTIEDFIKPMYKAHKDKSDISMSKVTTLFWGIFCTGFAFFTDKISHTVIESINMIGSIFYGPIAAVFLLGMLVKKSSSKNAIIGGLTGVILNLFLATGPVQISWLWWNATGFLTSFLTGYILSLRNKTVYRDTELHRINETSPGTWKRVYFLLFIYGIIIIFVSYFIKDILF